MAVRSITPEERDTVHALIARARVAMQQAESLGQADADRLIRAVAWAGGNEETATRLARMSVDESGLGSPEPSRRAKVLGILRDALRQKSMGVIEEIFKYHGFDDALDKVRQIFEAGGKGHSCGIYSFDDDHIHRLALTAPVSRMMVRQVQSRANAGTFTNGMPMTSSMGCGTWGGNITNENISLKHYMNVTWVSRPIPEDRPTEEELFGEFHNTPIFETAGAQ